MEYDDTTVMFVHLFFDTILKEKINENQHPKMQRMSFKMLYSLNLICA